MTIVVDDHDGHDDGGVHDDQGDDDVVDHGDVGMIVTMSGTVVMMIIKILAMMIVIKMMF